MMRGIDRGIGIRLAVEPLKECQMARGKPLKRSVHSAVRNGVGEVDLLGGMGSP